MYRFFRRPYPYTGRLAALGPRCNAPLGYGLAALADQQEEATLPAQSTISGWVLFLKCYSLLILITAAISPILQA